MCNICWETRESDKKAACCAIIICEECRTLLIYQKCPHCRRQPDTNVEDEDDYDWSDSDEDGEIELTFELFESMSENELENFFNEKLGILKDEYVRFACIFKHEQYLLSVLDQNPDYIVREASYRSCDTVIKQAIYKDMLTTIEIKQIFEKLALYRTSSIIEVCLDFGGIKIDDDTFDNNVFKEKTDFLFPSEDQLI